MILSCWNATVTSQKVAGMGVLVGISVGGDEGAPVGCGMVGEDVCPSGIVGETLGTVVGTRLGTKVGTSLHENKTEASK